MDDAFPPYPDEALESPELPEAPEVARQATRGSFGLALFSGVPAAVLSGVWFFLGLAPSVVFGPWQGGLLDPDPLYGVPLCSHTLLQLLAMGSGYSPAWLSNVVSAAAGAAACGALAFLTTSVLASTCRRSTAWLGGLAAAAILASTNTLYYAATGAGPAPLTLAFMLLSTVFLLPGLHERRMTLSTMLSGTFAGLAAANHSSFTLLAIVYLLALVAGGKDVLRTIESVVAFAVAFALAATLPLFHALDLGEPLHAFLEHALQTPYPTLGDAAPDWRFGEALFGVIPLALFLLAVPGAQMLFRKGAGGVAALGLCIVLCMGPFRPFLTNQYTSAHTLVEDDAPFLVLLSFVALFMACGMAALAERPFRARPDSGLATTAEAGVCLLLAGVCLAFLLPPLPNRQHDWASKLARETLQSAPPGCLLITGTPEIYSVLRAVQLNDGLRDDVTLTPIIMLTDTAARTKLAVRLAGRVDMPVLFPDADALERWKLELPYHFSDLAKLEHPARGPLDFEAFALWDLVSQNLPETAFAYAGVQPDWLTARASAHGMLLIFPPSEEAAAPAQIPLIYGAADAPADRGAAETLCALLLPLTARAMRQSEPDLALQLAQTAAEYAPADFDVQLAVVRAQARVLTRDELTASGESFLERWRDATSGEKLRAAIETSLGARKTEQGLTQFLGSDIAADTDAVARRRAFDPLWEREELAALRYGYEQILDKDPRDMDALYQLAAVNAQLGNWEKADELLSIWVVVGKIPVPEILRQINQDGRFAQFQSYRKHTFLPSQFQS